MFGKFRILSRSLDGSFSYLVQLARENRGLLLGVVASGVFCLILIASVILPAWRNPRSKFYGSGLGFPAVMRKLGKPLPADVAVVKRAPFSRWIMGEGTYASLPLLAPVIPMATVKEVLTKPGDRVTTGQVLARLDTTLATTKLESAILAMETAKAELARVRVGSAYVLAQERPAMEKVNLTAEEQLLSQKGEKVTKFREAFGRGAVSRTALLVVEGEFTEATRMMEKARLQVAMSEKGVVESIQIAENAVKDAEELVSHRRHELDDYDVRSPGNGIVERILINAGEYNQDGGKPGFVIASGSWFEAYFDQADFGDIQQNLMAEVHLEAFPGKSFNGKINLIVPVVSFNQGGPEISRPLRPRGSGAAEWAATFRTQIHFESDPSQVALGMTGFARVHIERESLAIPRGALVSVSAGSGFVYIVGHDGRWATRIVGVGMIEDNKAEILSGLSEGDHVIVRGHWSLKAGDDIHVDRVWDSFTAPEKL